HRWRDPAWGAVVTALVAHPGFSRIVLTGSRRPAPLPSGFVVVEPAPLSELESVLLARQLRTLGAQVRGEADVPAAQSRDLVARLLTTAGRVSGRIVE